VKDDPYLDLISGGFPHCDALILHPKDTCKYCEMPEYDVLHEYRRINGINYTGEHDPSKETCPAEKRRSYDTINKWYGNVPKDVEDDS
jgi:hypothetical protein